jgi:tryptophan-rich sensory protein
MELPLFLSAKSFVSFFEIILLEISIGLLIFKTYKIKPLAGYLLVPYFLWVGFASILNLLSAK